MHSAHRPRDSQSELEIPDAHEMFFPMMRSSVATPGPCAGKANALHLDDRARDVLHPFAHTIGVIRLEDFARANLRRALLPDGLALGETTLGLLKELRGNHDVRPDTRSPNASSPRTSSCDSGKT